MDSKDRPDVSYALWIPLIWMMILGSKPVSSWWESDAGKITVDTYSKTSLEGSPVDRNIYILLMVIGLLVLVKRGVHWREIFRNNSWIILLFAYYGVSALWADFPLVSLKRWIKEAGSLVMVLTVLTESDPVEGIKALIARFTYILIPLSILFIEVYPSLGTYSDFASDTPLYSGVSYNKNGLGCILLVSGIFLSWNLLALLRKKKALNSKKNVLDISVNTLFLLTVLWLTFKAQSATSLLALIIGIFILAILPVIKGSIKYIGSYILAFMFVLLLFHLAFDLYKTTLSTLGREATLTDRTLLWEDVLGMNTNPLIGTGYESFWMGDRLEKLWADHIWMPNQAHNGYIEIYINLGLIGLFFLAGAIISAYRKICVTLRSDFDYGRFRMAFLAVILMYNITEAAFKFHILSFVFLLIAADTPRALDIR